MKTWLAVFFSLLLLGCASKPLMPKTEKLFNDQLFASSSAPIDADQVFALSKDMMYYLQTEIAPRMKAKGSQNGLFDALYSKQQLMVEYDSVMTKNAAQTFESRAGNCLSLAIMTAAFAKEIGLKVQYQSVDVEDTWSRSGDLYVNAGHVNLTLGRRDINVRPGYSNEQLLTIDFLPPQEIGYQHTHAINEETILAMYMNNRAAELLVQGKLDDAYWAAREAIRQDANFVASYNTLAVIYQRHGNLPEAEQLFSYALQFSPDSTVLMSNLAVLFKNMGKLDEANAMNAKLQKIQPYPPFYFFQQGQAAMQRENFAAARILFSKEVARDPYYHEFHFWLAQAYFRLGDFRQAGEQLAIAQENSTTRHDHDLYAAKLDRLKSYRAQ